jgi:replicative DNA helicase
MFSDPELASVAKAAASASSKDEVELLVGRDLTDLRTVSVSEEQAHVWCRRIIDYSVARRVDEEIARVSSMEYEDTPGIEKLARLRSILEGLSSVAVEADLPTMASVTKDFLRSAESVLDGENSGVIFVGLDVVDRMLKGLRPGDLTLISAEGGCGKTTLAQFIARAAAAQDKHVLLAEGEMTAFQLGEREAHILVEKDISESWRRHEEIQLALDLIGIQGVALENIRVDTEASIRPAQLEAKVRQLQATEGCDLLIVDHLDHISVGADLSIYEQTARAIDAMKSIAKRLTIPVVVLGHINREGERDKGTPNKSWLRGSTKLGGVPDNIIIPTRNVSKGSNYVTFWVVKARQGITGPSKAVYNPVHGIYSEAA